MARKRKKKQSGRTTIPDAIPTLNHNAAGLDIGANEIYAAVPADRDEAPVRCLRHVHRGVDPAGELVTAVRN